MLWLLVVLAGLNEVATTNPGAPPIAPRAVDVVVVMLLALASVGVGTMLNARASELRPARVRAPARHTMYAALTGIGVGLIVLVQTLILATFDPDMQHRYAMFAGEPWWPPVLRAFSAGVTEEVIFRFIGMAAVALFAFRRYHNAGRAYRVALVSTALVFGVLHFPGVSFAALVVILVNTAAGLIFGWIYWHWGLRYAILCHFMGGLLNQSLGPRLIG